MRRLTIFVTICLLCFTAVAGIAATGKNVAVTDAQGSVQVMSQGSSAWSPVTFGMMLSAGDTIKTGKDSYADLSFNGSGQDAIVRVDANSSMKITDYVVAEKVENKKIALDLAMGDILVKANHLKNESQFQVRTPTSVVGVRGTGFKVSVSAEK